MPRSFRVKTLIFLRNLPSKLERHYTFMTLQSYRRYRMELTMTDTQEADSKGLAKFEGLVIASQEVLN